MQRFGSRRLSALLAGFLGFCLLGACRDRRESPPLPSARQLRPYDFSGSTALVLERLCRSARRAGAAGRAAALLRCARAALDWYLVASLREDRALAVGLQRLLGGLGVLPSGPDPVGARILAGLERLFAQAARLARGDSTRHKAEAGLALVRLQRHESPTWGHTYLKGIAAAARDEAPWATQAQVIVLGAALDALRTAARSPLHRRSPLLLQGVGFPCPAEAEAARLAEETPSRPPSCPLACPSLVALVSRLPPIRRKTLVVAQCPLGYLGISQRAHGAYLSGDNLPLFRVLSFVLRTASSLRAKARDPLVAAVRGALDRLSDKLSHARFPLYYPEMSPGETVYFPLPFGASADAPARAPVYLALDETRIYAGPRPLLGVVGGAPAPLDWHAGFPFPGQPLLATDPASLSDRLAALRAVFARTLGSPLPPADAARVSLYADARLSGGRLNDLLDLLLLARVDTVEILARNRAGRVRAIPVRLRYGRRSEGPPLPRRRAPAGQVTVPATSEPWLTVHLGRAQLRLAASAGPLSAKPVTLPAADVAGLRKTLERTRGAYRRARGVQVYVEVDVAFSDVVRLLHHLRRDVSGRPLYENLWL